MGEMHKIKILDDSLIDKIAAGEVVENPSSVIKELIENSIDAGSNVIEIEIKEGGKSLIKIKDNGVGMNKEDAELCVKRHATSKISGEEDLFAIKTLGFRGEALASISAVSKFMLLTKKEGEVDGIKVSVEKENINVEVAGAEKGTVVKIEDLFYNVPARKKFLRSIESELNSLVDVIIRYSLAYPKISFKLTSNDKVLLNTTSTEEGLNTIQSVYGNETAKNMMAVEYEDDLISIKGYIGKPSIARGDKNRQTLFLNGRYVKSKEVSDAIKEGYHSLLFLDREPVYVISLDVDESKVDVNVHPRKEIVKINNIKDVCKSVVKGINNVLKESNLFMESDLERTRAQPQHSYSMSKDMQSTLVVEEDSGDKIVETGNVYDNAKPAIDAKHIGPFKILGQLNKTYIVAENAEGLFIVDQHAAEERVNYEKLLSELKDKAIKKQALIKPLIIESSAAEFGMIMECKEQLDKCGFEIEEYGQNNIVVRSMPFIFERPSKTLVTELVDELKEISKSKIDTEIEDRIIRFSCRKSIKAGEEMTMKEIESLLLELDKCQLPFTCPHGRPTIIQLSLADIEKKFKRTG